MREKTPRSKKHIYSIQTHEPIYYPHHSSSTRWLCARNGSQCTGSSTRHVGHTQTAAPPAPAAPPCTALLASLLAPRSSGPVHRLPRRRRAWQGSTLLGPSQDHHRWHRRTMGRRRRPRRIASLIPRLPYLRLWKYVLVSKTRWIMMRWVYCLLFTAMQYMREMCVYISLVCVEWNGVDRWLDVVLNATELI